LWADAAPPEERPATSASCDRRRADTVPLAASHGRDGRPGVPRHPRAGKGDGIGDAPTLPSLSCRTPKRSLPRRREYGGGDPALPGAAAGRRDRSVTTGPAPGAAGREAPRHAAAAARDRSAGIVRLRRTLRNRRVPRRIDANARRARAKRVRWGRGCSGRTRSRQGADSFGPPFEAPPGASEAVSALPQPPVPCRPAVRHPGADGGPASVSARN
jgi:hypothetical protein